MRAADGTLLWRFNTNAEVSRKPVLQNGVLYVVNANDTVVGDRRQDRQDCAGASTERPRSAWRSPATPGPLVTRDRVYVAFSDGHVAAYDPLDGTEQWPIVDLSAEVEQAQGEVPRYLDVDTTPVLDTITAGRVVYVASYAGGVFALDAQTGARVWVNDRAAGVTAARALARAGARAARRRGARSPWPQASVGLIGHHWALGARDRRRS